MKKLLIFITILVSLLLISSCGNKVNISQEGDLTLEISYSNVGFAGYMGGNSYIIKEDGTITLTKVEAQKEDSCKGILSQEDLTRLKKEIIDTGYFDSEFKIIGGADDVPISSYNISIGQTSKYLDGPLSFELGKKDQEILSEVDTIVSNTFKEKGCELS